MEYALWRSSRHYMVSKFQPARQADSIGELESYALLQQWYDPGPALIARADSTGWFPVNWVRKTGAAEIGSGQAQKYAAVRNGNATWPAHLGSPPTAP